MIVTYHIICERENKYCSSITQNSQSSSPKTTPFYIPQLNKGNHSYMYNSNKSEVIINGKKSRMCFDVRFAESFKYCNVKPGTCVPISWECALRIVETKALDVGARLYIAVIRSSWKRLVKYCKQWFVWGNCYSRGNCYSFESFTLLLVFLVF